METSSWKNCGKITCTSISFSPAPLPSIHWVTDDTFPKEVNGESRTRCKTAHTHTHTHTWISRRANRKISFRIWGNFLVARMFVLLLPLNLKKRQINKHANHLESWNIKNSLPVCAFRGGGGVRHLGLWGVRHHRVNCLIMVNLD